MAKQTFKKKSKDLPEKANPFMKNNGINAFMLLCSLLIGTHVYAAPPDYHLVNRFHLGGEGGWDYLTVDSEARRLYISRSTHVMVVDIETGKLVGDIPDTPGVHGIAVAPEFTRGFTSNGRADAATIFDLKTLKVIGQVKTGANPDAILYDPFLQTGFHLQWPQP